MIVLITGIPGAGKTLYAVSQLKKAVDANMSVPADEQRKIYCDITGLNIEGIEKPPLDWRQTPPKSLLIYDEAQFHKPFQAQRGLSPYDYIQELTIHRKTGHEMWFITQDVKRLHTNITEMAERHYHLDRPYGAKLATIYQYRGYERNPKSRSAIERAERKSLFNYDKKLFDLYESSQVDDGIKLRLPPKLIALALTPVALFGFSAYMFFSDDTQSMITGTDAPQDDTSLIANPLDTIDSATSQLVQQMPQTLSQAQSQVIEQSRVAIVISSSNGCTAKNSYGQPLELTPSECMAYNNQRNRFIPTSTDVSNKHSHISTPQVQTMNMSSEVTNDTSL